MSLASRCRSNFRVRANPPMGLLSGFYFISAPMPTQLVEFGRFPLWKRHLSDCGWHRRPWHSQGDRSGPQANNINAGGAVPSISHDLRHRLGFITQCRCSCTDPGTTMSAPLQVSTGGCRRCSWRSHPDCCKATGTPLLHHSSAQGLEAVYRLSPRPGSLARG